MSPYWSLFEPPDSAREAEQFMQRAIVAQAAEFVARENAWVERLLRALKPGETLCVHARQTEVDADGTRGWAYTWTTDAHVLPDGNVCSCLGTRRTWGPMPPCRTGDCTLRYGHPGECV